MTTSAIIVDQLHYVITPSTKRLIEQTFGGLYTQSPDDIEQYLLSLGIMPRLGASRPKKHDLIYIPSKHIFIKASQ